MKISIKTALIYIAWAGCLASRPAVSQDLQIAQASNLFGGDTLSSMQIDILPEVKDNTISKKSGRNLPVAIMGSPSLDVNSINSNTIALRGVDVMLVGKANKSLCKIVDLNTDGHPDLHCVVRTTGFRIDAATYTIVLQAERYDKSRLRGEDKLKIVGN